jgi:MFS family permease
VLAKVIDKGKRGSLMGWSATLAGFISIGFGLSLVLEWLAPQQNYVILLAVASCCFTVASFAYLLVDEPRGETEPSKTLLNSLANGWELTRSDSKFQAFITVRAMLVSSSLASPYLVMVVQNASGQGWLSALGNLGTFIVMAGFASLISARLWGGFADRDSRAVLAVTAAATCIACFFAYIVVRLEPDSMGLMSLVLFLLLSIIHQGVRLGRKTYVVDITEGNKRSDYIAVSNTAIGLILIVVGVLGSIIAEQSIAYAFVFFAVLAGNGFILCRFMDKPA